jgi:hypothetical protein
MSLTSLTKVLTHTSMTQLHVPAANTIITVATTAKKHPEHNEKHADNCTFMGAVTTDQQLHLHSN